MSQEGANGIDEGRYSLLYGDQLWNSPNPSNVGECNVNTTLLQPNSDGLTNHVEKKRDRKGGALKGSSSTSKEEGCEHEIHIMTERGRRKKMKDMFSNLHSLLPELPMKVDKSTIVDEAVKYIKTLEETLHQLEKKKAKRINGASTIPSVDGTSTIALHPPVPNSREAFLADQGKIPAGQETNPSTVVSTPQVTTKCFRTWISPNVTLNIAGEDAQFGICAAKKPMLVSTILAVLEKYHLDVVSSHVSSDHYKIMIMIQANANRIRVQFPEAYMIEEIYKLAAGEMRLLLST